MVVSNLFCLLSDLDFYLFPVFAGFSVNTVPNVVADHILFPISSVDHLEWFIYVFEKYVV